MKYKVGDKVKVKSKEWYDANKDDYGYIYFLDDMAEYCGLVANILSVNERYYEIDLDDKVFGWTDEMFE